MIEISYGYFTLLLVGYCIGCCTVGYGLGTLAYKLFHLGEQ